MGLFKNKKKIGLIADIIRCDEPSYLIWKWHPDGTDTGENKREYAIRNGSHLRVKQGEVAVFVYKQNSGQELDYIVGPHDAKLKTANLPVLSGLLGAFLGGDTPFQAEVYFINLARIIQTQFAVPFFDVFDPRFLDHAVPVAVRGSITFQLQDYKDFIRLHRLDSFSLGDFQKQVLDLVCRYIKHAVANAPITYNIPLVQIERKLADINADAEKEVANRLKQDFGVVVSGLDISSIELDKYSDEYLSLLSVSKDITTSTVHAHTLANLENYAENLRIQREEGQYASRMQTKTANLAAYQAEKQAEVGVAGAEALGKMGGKGESGVNLAGNSVAFNPAAMMASMAVGGVVAQNLSAAMGNALIGNGAPVPPPVPKAVYYVVKNGNSDGPHSLDSLVGMVTNGEIAKDTLVWKNGEKDWKEAKGVKELEGYFPPEVPD